MMLDLFKKGKPEKEKDSSAGRDKVAGELAKRLVAAQISWSDWMSRHFERLSLIQKKVMLIILGIGLGLYFGFLVISGFLMVAPDSQLGFTTTRAEGILKIPDRPQSMPDKKVLEKLLQFEQYVNGLDSSAAGIAEKNRILAEHPGLMDSLRTLKKYYQNAK